jgi:glucan phosphoethanolaminetransferase (alkaline phosphatase superfamily)
MPLFHGQSIVESHQTSNLDPIFWGMLLFFLLPMLAIIGVNFSESRSLRKVHFWLTILYSVLNLAHLIADLLVRPIAWYQIALMAILLIIGLILNLVSYQWLRLAIAHPHHLSESH